MTVRFRSEEAYQAAVEERARQIWDRSERRMWGDEPHFAKQTWEQGSELSKAKARECARVQLALEPTQ